VASTLISKLRADPALQHALAESFDFIVAPDALDVSWFTIKPADRVQPIARDPCGGVFVLYGLEEWVLHVTSEGQAGVVASNLRSFLTILVSFPYWLDLLKFSAGGSLDEMKRAIPLLKEQVSQRAQQLEAHRRLLSQQLGLNSDPAALEWLHAAVRDLSRSVRVLAPDGCEFDSLFNEFSADQL
jgi:hypothetical protein